MNAATQNNTSVSDNLKARKAHLTALLKIIDTYPEKRTVIVKTHEQCNQVRNWTNREEAKNSQIKSSGSSPSSRGSPTQQANVHLKERFAIGRLGSAYRTSLI
ncbi:MULTISPECIES: hypothetical protein [unclassified Pseudomonas]|uniref:hypothetical protein n=1 Tax=unclassified Pseudomonas TaxID=196821 RepID=UPI001CBD0E63|nr:MULTISPECIES: hypothetical protein [unclassified Pseudomonas]